MGGKAFGARTAVRLPTVDMEPIGRAAALATGGRLVRWLRTKQDHGDADVVVPTSVVAGMGDEAMALAVANATGYGHISRRPDKRDPILFVGLETPHGLFQVDLIAADDELLDFAHRYLSYGEIGTMIGRIAREMGLRFGQNGLRVPISVPNAQAGSVLLTADFDRALAALGFDPSVHARGFDALDEVLDYVASGAFFDPKVFEPMRGSADSRGRAKKRPAVGGILDSLQDRPANFEWPEHKGPNPLQDECRAAVVAHFGKGDAVRAELERQTASIAERPQTAFSLEAIAEATGLQGRDVRAIATIIKEPFTAAGRDFPAWRDSATADEVRDAARAAMPILRERREEEARRAERAERHRRNAEANRLKRGNATCGN